MFLASFVMFKAATETIIKEACMYVYSKVKMLAFDNGGTVSNVTVWGTGLIFIYIILFYVVLF
jgi:hypothetical protein